MQQSEHLPSFLACVTRRQFLVQGSVAGVAVVLVGCGLGFPTAPTHVNLTIDIANYPPLANAGGVAYVDASGSPLAVVRLDAVTFEALSRVCPHQGGTVNAVSGGFLCPNHGAQFDDIGAWAGGQPTGNLTTYPTHFDSSTGMLAIG